MTPSTAPKPAARRAGPLGRLRRVAGQAEELLCYALLVALVATTSLQVFTRYVINAPFTWTEELARMLFIWIVFVGAAVIVKQSSHISIDFVTRLLPPGPQRVVLIISHVVSVAILLTLGVKAVLLLRITGHSASPALEVPWVCVYAAFPLGMFLMAARYTGALIRLVRGADGPTVPGQGAPPAAGPEEGR